MAWATHAVRLDAPVDADGTTMRKQLVFVQKQTGVTPPELIPPVEFPPAATKVWEIYKEGFMRHKLSPEPTSYQELQAYLSLTGETLQVWEVQALKSLDTTYISLLLELNKANRGDV